MHGSISLVFLPIYCLSCVLIGKSSPVETFLYRMELFNDVLVVQ